MLLKGERIYHSMTDAKSVIKDHKVKLRTHPKCFTGRYNTIVCVCTNICVCIWVYVINVYRDIRMYVLYVCTYVYIYACMGNFARTYMHKGPKQRNFTYEIEL